MAHLANRNLVSSAQTGTAYLLCFFLSSLPQDRQICSKPGIAMQGKGLGFSRLRDGEVWN